MKEYLEAGIIVNTHGVHGDIKMKNYCDSPDALASIKTLYVKKEGEYFPMSCTKSVPVGRDMQLVHFKNCDSFEEAIKLKGVCVYAKREDIPISEGSCFIADIIGLPVIDSTSGQVYGVVSDVFNQGAQDIYEVQKKDGKTGLIPAVSQFINKIDIESGVYVTLIEGLL